MTKQITYGSVCSGIEAASLAFEPLGWQPSWFAEIDKFAAAVLANRWPHVPNHGDMTTLPEKILYGDVDAPDVLVGGTPCQAFSVAGMRGSLDDDRGNLTLVLVRILDAIDTVRLRRGQPPALLIWENVPGVLSTKDNAFGCFLGALAGQSLPLEPAGRRWTNAGCVFRPRRKIAWRTLDAQFFGVAQRRKRVFVIAGSGDVDAAKILFESESVRGDFEAGNQAKENSAAFIEGSFGAYSTSKVGGTLKASGGAIQGGSETLVLASQKNATGTIMASCGEKMFLGNQEAFSGDYFVVNGRQDPCASNKAYALDCQNNGMTNVVCVNANIINKNPNGQSGCAGIGVTTDNKSYTLVASGVHAVTDKYQIRRLTPVECERLQGMPDNHTQIPWRGKPANDCPDSHRYKAIGNSMAVPVMRWIANRIDNIVFKD